MSPPRRAQRERATIEDVSLTVNTVYAAVTTFLPLTCTSVCALYRRPQSGGDGGRGRGPGAADVRQLFVSWSLVEAKVTV